MYGIDAVWAMAIVSGLGGFAVGIFFGLFLSCCHDGERDENK